MKGIANEVQYASKYAVYNTMGYSRNSQFECLEPPQLFKFLLVLFTKLFNRFHRNIDEKRTASKNTPWIKKGRKREIRSVDRPKKSY